MRWRLMLLLIGVASPVAGQTFGNSVAYADGYAFVGEPVYELRSGVVYVFTRSDSGWERTQRLEPSDAQPGDRFGIRAIARPDELFVSATRANGGQGRVHVFHRTGTNWSERGTVELPDASPADSLGSGLAASGRWLAVSSISRDQGRGGVHLFESVGGEWAWRAVVAPDGLDEVARFGASLVMEEGRLVVGAPGQAEGRGAVYVYRLAADDAWEPAGELTASAPSEGAQFGASLAIRDDVIVVGAPGFRESRGRVDIFALRDEQWSLAGALAPYVPEPNGFFGSAVGLDDETVWVGAPGAGQFQGRTYLFARDGRSGEWGGAQRIAAPSEMPGGGFGATLTDAGGRLLVADLGGDAGAGSAHVFERSGQGWLHDARLVGELLGPDPILGDEVGCTEQGEAGGFGCESVDLLSFLPVQTMAAERGVRANDLWGWTEPGTGREIALVGMTDRTVFVDVTRASDPSVLGHLPLTDGATASTWRDMKVYSNHVFVVADGAGSHGMQVFDLTRLTGLDGTAPVAFSEDARYDRVESAHNVVINEETGFAYIVGANGGGETCGGGLHMVDIRDPLAPAFAGCFQDPSTGNQGTGYSHDAQCVIYRGPDATYVGREICLGSNENALSIGDVTDKASPTPISMASYPNVGYAHQGWLSEDHAYFYMNDELDEIGGGASQTRTMIWDIRDLDDPILAREYLAENQSSDHNLYVLGNVMYQANYQSGLRIFDVSDPENPIPTGHFDTVPYGADAPGFGGAWSSYPYFESGVVLVTSSGEGLFVLRYTPRTIS